MLDAAEMEKHPRNSFGLNWMAFASTAGAPDKRWALRWKNRRAARENIGILFLSCLGVGWLARSEEDEEGTRKRKPMTAAETRKEEQKATEDKRKGE